VKFVPVSVIVVAGLPVTPPAGEMLVSVGLTVGVETTKVFDALVLAA
jgi:hypothetical protein